MENFLHRMETLLLRASEIRRDDDSTHVDDREILGGRLGGVNGIAVTIAELGRRVEDLKNENTRVYARAQHLIACGSVPQGLFSVEDVEKYIDMIRNWDEVKLTLSDDEIEAFVSTVEVFCPALLHLQERGAEHRKEQ